MTGFLFATGTTKSGLAHVLEAMNKATLEWTHRAARGECEWVCADCGMSFPEGMPNQCGDNLKACNKLIERDKLEATA